MENFNNFLYFSPIPNFSKFINDNTTDLDCVLEVINSAPYPITISRVSDGRYVEVNPAFEKAMEISREEAIGHTPEIFTWSDHENPIIRMHRDEELLLSGIKNREIEVYTRKTNRVFVGLFSASVIDIDRKPYILTIVAEITEKRKAEENLRLSEERFARIFRSSPVMLSILNFETHQFADVNEQWLKLLEYEREEVIGKTPSQLELIVDNWTLENIQIINKDLDSEGIFLRKKSGDTMEVLFSSEVIDFQDDKCLLITCIDITAKKQYERELIKLDRLNVIGQMANGISHEIRNPMTTVRGFLQFMAKKEKYREDREIFNLMISELDCANRIISDFLSLSLSVSSPKKVQDINEIVIKLFPLLQAQAYVMGKEIILDINEIPKIKLNEKEIKQLLINLVQNALEASPENGLVNIGTEYQDPYAILSIKDHGQGIPAQIMSKLGTPFFTTKEDGAGLGLARCYSIIERHNGKIEISTSHSGTTVSVLLPRTQSI